MRRRNRTRRNRFKNNRMIKDRRRKYRSRRNRRNRRNRFTVFCGLMGLLAVSIILCAGYLYGKTKNYGWLSGKSSGAENGRQPEQLLTEYMSCISGKAYGRMYAMLDVEASDHISLEDFTTRNAAIYEGCGVENVRIEIISGDKDRQSVRYRTSFDTSAGPVSFENEALFTKNDEGYRLIWKDSLIFPQLGATDRVRVTTTRAERGKILDRDGRLLAGTGTASSVGLVPGRIVNRKQEIRELATLLGLKPVTIRQKLKAGWVKEDSFVPVKTVPKASETELMSPEPSQEALKNRQLQEQLQEIPGVMIMDTKVREYPLKEAAAHLTGYVQNVTAEDLENHKGEGYTADSVIGRNGIEGLYEKELKGQNGCRIYITDVKGVEKEELACIPVQHGRQIKLTIDAGLQQMLYEQFRQDKSCSVAMNPFTGEVLALVSTPSYDNNDFIMGMSTRTWTALNEDEQKPLFNRFRQAWCPGSTFKPVIAAIGLETGILDPEQDYGSEGLSWQKDASWGAYHVTTLHACSPVNLDNAMIYSDNIYFAKVALKTGAENLTAALQTLGFGSSMPFEITFAGAQYSNTEKIGTEIQLADSGYGQGQILISPLHLAAVYSAFCNDGNIIHPYLRTRKKQEPQYWIRNAFSKSTADRVLESVIKVVNDPRGTGYGVHRDDVLLAGKTGTAEIKISKEDTTGTELGWFAVFTVDSGAERPVMLVSMTEDVKGRGGSGYVVQKYHKVLDGWFGDEWQTGN